MDIIEELNLEINKATDPLYEYKKWRRIKYKKPNKQNTALMVISQNNEIINTIKNEIVKKDVIDTGLIPIIDKNITNMKDNLKDNIDSINDNKKKEFVKTQVNKSIDKLKKIKDTINTKKVIKNTDPILRELYSIFIDFKNTKAGKGLLAALAYTNPITAAIYDNRDIIKGVLE